MDKIVFVVDDDELNLTMASLTLEKFYKVLTIPSAEKMFSILEKKRPDLILLDIEMPDMTGLEAYEKLKENPEWKNIAVIFLTGHDNESILTKLKESGALDVIHKPFSVSTLLECVKTHCP